MTSHSVEFFLNDVGDKIVKTGEVLEHLKTLEVQADNGGFSATEFSQLCCVVREKEMPAHIYRRFISCLVPAQPVPGRELCDLAMFALGNHLSAIYVANPVLQVINLCLEYDLVSEKRPLTAVYELFLAKLRQSALCDTIALILTKITSLGDVDARRAGVIKDCYDQHGGTASLNMLRYRIRQLRPDLEPTYSPPTAGRLVNNSVINRRFRKVFEDSSGKQSTFGLGWEPGQLANKVEYKDRQKRCLLPTGETVNLKGGLTSQKNKKIPVQSVESAAEGVQKLEMLELPNNILSLLPTFLGKYILPRKDLQDRFSLVLYHTLQKEFFSLPKVNSNAEKERRERRQKRFLEIVARFQTSCFHGIPVVGRFLSEYLVEWDGEQHFFEIVNLLQVVQITDFKELYDTLLFPLESFLESFSISKKIVLLDAYFKLLKFWCTIEMSRITDMKACLFPDSTQLGSEAVVSQALSLLSHIKEVTCLILSSAREEFSSQLVFVTRNLVDMFVSTHNIFLRLRVPVLVQMPEPLVHADMYCFSPFGTTKICRYLYEQKKLVLPMLREKALQMEKNGKSNLANRIRIQFSSPQLATLESIARDVLMTLSPTIVFKTQDSIFNRAGLDEDEIIRDMFLSEQPAFFSLTLEYFGDRSAKDASSIWSGLKSDRVYGTESQDVPIFSVSATNSSRISSVQFYRGRLSSGPAALSNPEVDSYLKHVGEKLPDIADFFNEFWRRPQPAGVNSVLSSVAESSGIYSMESAEQANVSTRSRRSTVSKDQENISKTRLKQVAPRSTSKRKSDEANNSRTTRAKRAVLSEMN